MKSLLIFALIYVGIIECQTRSKRVLEVVAKVWSGTNIQADKSALTTGLAEYKVFNQTIRDTGAPLCVSFPGPNPVEVDPTGVIWPHSGTATFTGTWDEMITHFCDETNKQLDFILFNGVGCNKAQTLMTGFFPTGFTVANKALPLYPKADYTEVVQCRTYLESNAFKLITSIFSIMITIFLIL